MSRCHYYSVEQLDADDWFIPLLHLNSYDFARYLYKWYSGNGGLVQIHYGDREEWGNWGVMINPDVAELFFNVLDFEDDYVLVCAATLVGEDQAVLVQPDAVSWVWSRYLRSYRNNSIPLQLDWHHPRERQVSTADFVSFPCLDDSHQQIIISGAFHPEHHNWHQIFDANSYAKFLYKWGRIVYIGAGTMTELGNWGIEDDGQTKFIVLAQNSNNVLIRRTRVVEQAIVDDDLFAPMWCWSRLLRVERVLPYPRRSEWSHSFEPQRSIAQPNAHYLRPFNVED